MEKPTFNPAFPLSYQMPLVRACVWRRKPRSRSWLCGGERNPFDQMRYLMTIVLLATIVHARGQMLSDSLIAHFPMDGDPNDTVENRTPTVVQGLPGFCADRFGAANSAACFDGNDFWSYGDVLDMDTADLSIACWLRVDSVHEPFQPQPGFWDYGGIPICKGLTVVADPSRSGYGLLAREPQPGGFSAHWVTGGDNNDVVDVKHEALLDTWQHVVMSRCGVHQLLYINGVLVADSLT
ncbi:MAG TPA: hypothetical protein PK760_08160, partial [Flavobacteriales bacterium]|nr:hypothetical protein [Flavobacteriales bacterium]